MSYSHEALLSDPAICAALRLAWEDSRPGSALAHEEGGSVLRDPTGELSVSRWPHGSQRRIFLPPHPECRIAGRDIVATFHTHPNPGRNYIQNPGERDRRAVRGDPDLKGEFYVGEFVISHSRIYLILPNGEVIDVADTANFLG